MHESIHSNVYAPLQGMKYFLVSATRPQQPGCAAVRCGSDAADITLKSLGSRCLTSACVRAASLASTSKMAQDKLLPHSQDGRKEESTSFGSNGFVYITHSVTLACLQLLDRVYVLFVFITQVCVCYTKTVPVITYSCPYPLRIHPCF